MTEYIKKYKYEIASFLITFTLASLVLFFSAIRFSNDDQFILYRYIQNISDGNGFVYNVGENVLGATTITFTLLASLLAFLLPFVSVPDVVAILNIFLISFGAVFFYKVARLFINQQYSLIAVIIFALNLSKVIPEGMETSLFILLSFMFFYYLLSKRFYLSSIFLSLLVLTRPDAVIIALFALIYWYQHSSLEKTIRYILLSILITIPWLVFATFYFGSFVPQSIMAKMHTSDIVIQSNFQALKVQLAHMSRIYWGKIFDPNNMLMQVVFNLIPFVLLFWFSIKKYFNKDNWILFLIPITYFAFFSLSNPVMFPWYLSQAEPLLILITFIYVAFILKNIKMHYLQLVVLFVISVGPIYFWTNNILSNKQSSKLPLFEAGLYLKENVKDGESVGVNNIGIIGFTSGARILDFFGLVNIDSPYFYPVIHECRDKQAQYIIPPNLIMHFSPEWIYVNGDSEMVECFKTSKWFSSNYELKHRVSGATIYKKSQ